MLNSSTIYTRLVIFLEDPRLRKFGAFVAFVLAFPHLTDIHLIAQILHHQTHWQGIKSWVPCPTGKKNLQPSPGSVLSLSCCRLSSLNMERRLMRFCRLGDIASPSMPPLGTSTTSLSSSGCSIAGSSTAKLGDAGATVGGRLSTTSSTFVKGIFTSLWRRSASKSFHNNFSASSSSSTISSTDNGVVDGVLSSFPTIMEASKTRKAWRLLQSSLCLSNSKKHSFNSISLVHEGLETSHTAMSNVAWSEHHASEASQLYQQNATKNAQSINDDNHFACSKQHRLCMSLFQELQKRAQLSCQQSNDPLQFHQTKVQLFLGSPNGRLQLLTLRIQLQQFIIHFLSGFSVFCNLGCYRVCCFQSLAFANLPKL